MAETLTNQGAIKISLEGSTLTGEIRMWPTGTPPTGWLICNGDGVSTTTYANLFAVIGYTFGGGGATFNLPDFRDRSPQGASATDAIGATVGTKMQTSVPQHRHSIFCKLSAGGAATLVKVESNASTDTTTYTQYTGEAAGVDQRGPRLAINFIIRI